MHQSILLTVQWAGGMFQPNSKIMLRKVVTKEGKDWDKLPQLSHHLNSYMAIMLKVCWQCLKEAWESGTSQDASTVAHVVQIREPLQQMTGLVQQNMMKSQDVMIEMLAAISSSQEIKSLCCTQHQPAGII